MTRMPKVMLSIMLTSGLLLAGCQSSPEPQDQTNPTTTNGAPEIGNLAPDFQLDSLEGDVVSLTGVRGNPIMLNFWATWCPPCRDEMPYLQQIYDEWTSQGLTVLTIDMGEERERVIEFLETYNLSLPTLLDTEQEIAQMYNIRAIPTTFFIDRNGIIQKIKVGSFRNRDEIERYLAPIMAQ